MQLEANETADQKKGKGKPKKITSLAGIRNRLDVNEYSKVIDFCKDVRAVIKSKSQYLMDKMPAMERKVREAESTVAVAPVEGAEAMQGVDAGQGGGEAAELKEKLGQSKRFVQELENLNETFNELWEQESKELAAMSVKGLKKFTEEERAEANSKIQAAEESNSSRSALSSKRPVFTKQLTIGGSNRVRSGFSGSSKLLGRLPGSAASSSSSSSACCAPALVKAEEGEEEEKEENFKPQKDMPKEEDLNNWSHHFSAETTDDEYITRPSPLFPARVGGPDPVVPSGGPAGFSSEPCAARTWCPSFSAWR